MRDALSEMKKAIIKTFGRKGEEIVNMNLSAITRGSEVEKVEVPAEWAKLEIKTQKGYAQYPRIHQECCRTHQCAAGR